MEQQLSERNMQLQKKSAEYEVKEAALQEVKVSKTCI
jgi:hypothetical protein